jgi:Fe-S oxidoreductase
MSLREGGLQAPTRHPLDWQNEAFYDEKALTAEMDRVFDLCNGCRRCVSLCDSFPSLFDMIDESPTFDLDGADKTKYADVVEHCYLCDLCYQTKCPYVPPHEWAIDYPHLMLRAKAVQFRKEGASMGRKVLSATTAVGKLATIPLVDVTVNALNRTAVVRKALEGALGVHHKARVPTYDSRTLKRRLKKHQPSQATVQTAGPTRGRVAVFGTCYGTYNTPQMGEDLFKVFEHNGIPATLVQGEKCCGMPKLELGDLPSVAALKEHNIPILAAAIRDGWDIVAPIPSCTLMFKQELPLMFPDDADVQLVKANIFDPFEYLMHRHKAGLLRTDFTQALGKVAYQVACHRHRGESHRALLGARRHLCGPQGNARPLDEDRETRGEPGEAVRPGIAHQRLPHGRRPYRARHGPGRAARAPAQPVAPRLRHLRIRHECSPATFRPPVRRGVRVHA